MKLFISSLLFLAIVSSCSKSSTPVDPPIINELKATISIDGSTAKSYSAINGQTVFAKRVDSNGDTVYVIAGGMATGQVGVTLVNITKPGTYSFGQSFFRALAFCDYTVGNPFAPLDLYSTLNNTLSNGEVIIESITSTSIKGSFFATCTNNTGKVIQITEGAFKGEFN